MTAAFSGPPEAPQFWVSTNDFWEMKTDNWYPENWSVGPGKPRPLGRLVFDIPALKGGSLRLRQRFVDAQTIAEYQLEGSPVLRLRCFIAASENVLLCELRAERELELKARFLFPGETGYGCEESAKHHRHLLSTEYRGNPPGEYREDRLPLTRGYRVFQGASGGGIDQETKLAFAGRFLCPASRSRPPVFSGNPDWSKSADLPALTLAAGETLWYALVLRSAEKILNPDRAAAARAETFTAEDAAFLEDLHRSWWKDYWNLSRVEIEDPLIENRYYLSYYVMGSLYRDPAFPPNIFGVSTWDDPDWNGDYKINYNHEAAFWGLYASGRWEQADCFEAPALALEAQARQIAEKETGHRGILMPGGLGPKGLVAENMIYHMKSMGAMLAMNMAMRWYTSYDRAYGRKIYSYLRGIVDFWEQDLEFDGQYYHNVNDHAHEVWDEVDTLDNPATLGFVRTALGLILDISAELGVDEGKRETWRELRDKLAPYPVGKARDIANILAMPRGLRLAEILPPEVLGDKDIFLLHRRGEDYSMICAVTLHQIFPAGDLGFNSDPALLQIARNTLELRIAQGEHYDEWNLSRFKTRDGGPMRRGGAWDDVCQDCVFFPSAVRMGWDPEDIWAALKKYQKERGLSNGYLKNNPHGVEKLSIVPNTVQEMMLLSYEGILRFFRGWPKKSQPNAAFTGLRAYGAFRVSARLEKGTVKEVSIYSEKGRPCRVEAFSPEPAVFCGGTAVPAEKEGGLISFPTTAGMTYCIR
jgi:hypothetical protein